jgi:hypothetical protein
VPTNTPYARIAQVPREELAEHIFFTPRSLDAFRRLVRPAASDFEARKLLSDLISKAAEVSETPPEWANVDRIHPDAWVVLGRITLPIVHSDIERAGANARPYTALTLIASEEIARKARQVRQPVREPLPDLTGEDLVAALDFAPNAITHFMKLLNTDDKQEAEFALGDAIAERGRLSHTPPPWTFGVTPGVVFYILIGDDLALMVTKTVGEGSPWTVIGALEEKWARGDLMQLTGAQIVDRMYLSGRALTDWKAAAGLPDERVAKRDLRSRLRRDGVVSLDAPDWFSNTQPDTACYVLIGDEHAIPVVYADPSRIRDQTNARPLTAKAVISRHRN